ncbi:MAG: family 16 glycoside hydrolase [Leptolyngbyaceae cyanobacterium]
MSQNASSDSQQSPAFPFSNDILGRYFCNTLDEAIQSNEGKPFDVVVIGSGMYGSYIASKLYFWSKREDELGKANRLKILVLEAGPFITHEHIENLPPRTGNVFDEVNQSPYMCHVYRPGMEPHLAREVEKHSYCVGGKSLTWGKWSPRLTEKDLESELWPQEVKEFLNDKKKGYKRVEDETGVSDYSDLINGTLFTSLKKLLSEKLNSSSSNHLTIMPPPVAVAASSTVSGLYSPDAFSSLGWLLENIRIESEAHSEKGSPLKSIYLVPNTLAYKLETERSRVSSINVVDVNSKKKSSIKLSSQCDVILAGTAIESTRLALNSFPKSADPKDELIGRNLMGHLFSSISVRIKRTALNLPKDETLESALYHLQGYSNKFQKSYHYQLFCSSDSNFDVFTTLYKMFYDFEAVVDILQSQQSEEWVTILVLACAEVKGKPDVPLYTKNSNWMHLSEDKAQKIGQVEYRKPYLGWESSPEDELFWDEVHSTLFNFLESLVPSCDIQYLDPNNPKDPNHPYPTADKHWKKDRPKQYESYKSFEAFWNSRHESGTLWMGEKAESSVTDLDGKFHRIQNVYCADQAIFPTVGSANPVLTGLTLDRKIAQGIIDRYKNVANTDDNIDFDKYRPLFNGTFEGWNIQSKGKSSICSDATLELKPEYGHGVAWYKLQTFSEFDLIIDWKVFDNYVDDEIVISNAGIVIHAPDPGMFPEDDDALIYEKGYEIQIDESGYNYPKDSNDGNRRPSYHEEFYGSPLHKTGAIYDVAAANRGNTKKPGLYRNIKAPGFWNRFRIISTKSGIKVHLNGKLVSSLSPLLKEKKSEGYICLQFHTNRIQFRNVLIREHQKDE